MSRSLFGRSLPCAAALAALCAAAPLIAQTPSAAAPAADRSKAQDPAERLRAVLPADVAERVLATVAQARARQLPAQALEARALKFAMRGENPAAIERAVTEHSARLARSQTTLSTARGGRPSNDEVEAGAEALRQGVDGAAVSALAKSAPSGRSLAVPLYVLGQLAARGLPSDEALARVRERLAARASDAELEQLSAQAIAGRANRPADIGRDVAQTRRPGNAGGGAGAAGGAPAGVPANVGAGARPAGAGRPATPANRP
jgi:hypothetical protein